MKKVALWVTLLTLATTAFIACNKQEDDEPLYNVRLVVDDFEISEEEFNSQENEKSTRVDSSLNVQFLTVVIFDEQGHECERVVHSKIEGSPYHTSNFGTFYFLLPTGDYTVVTVGHWNNPDDTTYNLIVSSPTVAAFNGNATDCFGNVQSVTISSTSNNLISVTLSRMVAAMNLRSTDRVTQRFDSIRMSLTKGSIQFNPTSGFALSNSGVSQTFRINPEYLGEELRLILYTFLPTNRETADFTFTVFGQQGTPLIERTFVDVTLKRNRKTIATGEVFNGVANTFRVETSWDTDTTINF